MPPPPVAAAASSTALPATNAVNMAVANLVQAASASTAAGSTATPGGAATVLQGYVVSKNEALIQEALKQSQEQERLRAAKAMLYHAYLQALGATASALPQPSL